MNQESGISGAVAGAGLEPAVPRDHGSIIDWKPLLYWACVLLVLFVLGPIAGTLVGDLRGSDGQPGVTPLASPAVVSGLIRAAGVLAIAAGAGLLGSRLFHVRDGLTFAGLVVAWAAYRTGTPDAMLRHTQDTGCLWRLSFEGLVLGLLGVLVCGFVASAHRPQAPEVRTNRGLAGREGESIGTMLTTVAAAAAAGAAAGGVVAWLVAVETMKLQTIAAAVGAAIAAGAVVQMVVTVMPGPAASYRRTLVAGALAMTLLALVGPVSSRLVYGSAGVLRAAYGGNYFGLAAPLALDWVAGALLGLPLGLSWSGSMIEKRRE